MTSLVVATLLWEANQHSHEFSRCYDETWVTKLYHGFRRNLTVPHRFVLFTDKVRDLPPEIGQQMLRTPEPDYGTCIEPYRLGEAMILVGLDTLILRNIDHLAERCFSTDRIALPRDPYAPQQACNGVALVPAGQRHIHDNWRGENDMEWVRKFPHHFIDDLFPGHVTSYKGSVRQHGLGDARICYFHGNPKMHDVLHLDWVRENWRDG